MKLSPKNKVKGKNYPKFREYKEKIMITTFTVGMILTPAMLTSCNSKSTNLPSIEKSPSSKNQTIKTDKHVGQNKKTDKDNKKIEKAQRKGERKAPTIKKPEQLDGEIATPIHKNDNKNLKEITAPSTAVVKVEKALGQQALPIPKNKVKKDDKKEKTQKDPLNIPTKPHKLRGKVRAIDK